MIRLDLGKPLVAVAVVREHVGFPSTLLFPLHLVWRKSLRSGTMADDHESRRPNGVAAGVRGGLAEFTDIHNVSIL
jgi:hypothetical protein